MSMHICTCVYVYKYAPYQQREDVLWAMFGAPALLRLQVLFGEEAPAQDENDGYNNAAWLQVPAPKIANCFGRIEI